MPGADRHALERVVGDVARHAGLLGQQFVQVPKERAAAGEDDAAVDDVGGELRGRLLEHGADGLDDGAEAVLDGLRDLDARSE